MSSSASRRRHKRKIAPQKGAAALSNARSLTLSVPYELLALIFVHTLPPDGRVKPSPKTAPLLVAQVCRQWRDVALSVPELWVSINFDRKSVNITLVESWFSRAGNHPLSITDPPSDFMPMVASHLPRCGRLELVLWETGLFDRPALEGQFPYLRTLALRNQEKGTLILDEAIALTDLLIAQAPALEVIHFCPGFGRSFSTAPDRISTSVSAVELNLDYGSSVATQISNLCERFPCLRHLVLHRDTGIAFNEDLDRGVAIAVFPPICSLVVISQLLVYLTLPTLQELALAPAHPAFAEPLKSFLARSSCSLRRLTVIFDTYGSTWDRPDLRLSGVFKRVPNLVDLILDNDHRSTFDLLYDTTVLPALRHIQLYSDEEKRPMWGSFLRLVRARQGTLRLATYSASPIYPQRGPRAHQRAAFSAVAKGGMEITLKNGVRHWRWGEVTGQTEDIAVWEWLPFYGDCTFS